MDNLTHYKQTWTRVIIIPWTLTVLVELFCYMAGSWTGTGIFDLAHHLLLLTPLIAWSLGRGALRRAELPVGHHAAALSGAEPGGYRVAISDGRPSLPGDGWFVSGNLPSWAIWMFLLYLLVDVIGVLSLGVLFLFSFALVAVARAIFYYFWFTRWARDAGRAGVLLCTAEGGSQQFVLQTAAGIGPVSITRFDAGTLELRLDVGGAAEIWKMVGRLDLARFHKALATARRAARLPVG